MQIPRFIRENLAIIIYFILSVFAILPFFASGFFTVHDDTQVARVYEMARAISDGMFPVRWAQDLGYGFGYPIFNFYSVLPYYLGTIFVNFGLNALLATKGVFIIAIIFSGASMFLFVKSFFGKTAGLVSGVVYLYFPYHAVNTYVRGDLAEIFAYAFLPLVFLGFFKIHGRQGSVRLNIIIASIALSAVIISHNLSFFMAIIFILLFMMVSLLMGEKKTRLAISYGLILLIAFLLSAFYSIPAIFEMKYSNILSQIGGGSYYKDHFVCIGQLWDSPWGFGGSAAGCVDGISLKLGKLNIILAIVAFVFFIFGKRVARDKFFLILVSFLFLIFSIFLTLEYSSYLWQLPYMDFLQFPWRFLNFTGIFLSLVIGFLVWRLQKIWGITLAIALSSLIILGTLFYNVKLFTPQSINDENSSFYTNPEYLNWTVSKISDEYLPRNFTKPKSQVDIRLSPIDIVQGGGAIEVLESKTQELRTKINLDIDGVVRINKAFFPAWKVYVDGKDLPYAARDDGLYFSLQKGDHDVFVKFISTPIEKASNILSVVGFLILLAGIIGKRAFLSYGKKTS